MSNTIDTFGFTVHKMDQVGVNPTDPSVNICLKHWTVHKDGDAPQVTPDLMSATEIEEYIKLLKDDLDHVCHEAKSALVKSKKAMHELKH